MIAYKMPASLLLYLHKPLPVCLKRDDYTDRLPMLSKSMGATRLAGGKDLKDLKDPKDKKDEFAFLVLEVLEVLEVLSSGPYTLVSNQYQLVSILVNSPI